MATGDNAVIDLSVVSPAHNESRAIRPLIERVSSVLSDRDLDWELVLVDDGSTDDTWDQIAIAAAADARVRGIRLSRNFGHQLALTAGMSVARGAGVVTMDSDLQHPPEVIPALLDKAAEGYDVVYAVREQRAGDGPIKAFASDSFYWLLNRLARLDLPEGGADFRFLSRRVLLALRAMPERHRFVRGLTRWVGYPQTVVKYQQADREHGSSKYTGRKMLKFALDGIVSFSAVPLRIASVLGFGASFLGLVYLGYVVAVHVFSSTTVPGWTSVVAAVLLLGGAQLVCLGIIGSYLGRMYDEVKGRPLFLISDDTELGVVDQPMAHIPQASGETR